MQSHSNATCDRACAFCGRTFRPQPFHVRRGHGQFCSISCAARCRYGSALYRLLQNFHIDPVRGCWLFDGFLNEGGYGCLRDNGKEVIAHRLSATQLAVLPDPSADVLHCCDVRNCFCPDHLFYGDNVSNTRDRVRKGRSAVGERIHRAKLTEADVRTIRTRFSGGERQVAIATDFGISRQAVYSIVRGRGWKHVS